MSSPLYYLHHRPAAKHGGLLKLPGQPSPLGQICMLQAQASQIWGCAQLRKKAPSLCTETLQPAHWLLKGLLLPFCRDKELRCISEVVSPTSQRNFSHTTVKGSHFPGTVLTHVEGTSHTQVCEY